MKSIKFAGTDGFPVYAIADDVTAVLEIAGYSRIVYGSFIGSPVKESAGQIIRAVETALAG